MVKSERNGRISEIKHSNRIFEILEIRTQSTMEPPLIHSNGPLTEPKDLLLSNNAMRKFWSRNLNIKMDFTSHWLMNSLLKMEATSFYSKWKASILTVLLLASTSSFI
jgi:hypothetical protein